VVIVRIMVDAADLQPQRKTAGAVGYDLRAADDYLVPVNGIGIIETGVRIELPIGVEAQVRPRSGMTSRRLFVQLGTIDSDYRGVIGVQIVNGSGSAQTIKRGDRIAQLVFASVLLPTLVEAEALSETARGDKGFGSTGVT
jgi:dUTP pyrophosphatase